MGRVGGWTIGAAVSLAAFAAGCSHRAAAKASDPVAQVKLGEPAGRRYVDPELGFEIARPTGEWQLDVSDDLTPEGVATPVVLRHKDTGAQVVVQVAPAVATPSQFAERLTTGLRTHPGFTSTDPEPLAFNDGAVGFQFAMGDAVFGRVAVLEGTTGKVLMMLATWPANAPQAVPDKVEEIFGSIHPVPRG